MDAHKLCYILVNISDCILACFTLIKDANLCSRTKLTMCFCDSLLCFRDSFLVI